MTKSKQKADNTRYRLTNDFIKNIQKHVDYNYINNLISDNGSFQYTINGVDVKFYTAEMAILLLQTKDLEVINRDTKNNELVKTDCTKYLNTYIEAFKQGQYYFENELKFSPNKLSTGDVARAIENIQTLYYEPAFPKKPLIQYKRKYPTIINYENIYEYGYNAGIVSSIDELLKNYPKEVKNTILRPKGYEKIFGEDFRVWNVYLKCYDLLINFNDKDTPYASISVIFQTLIDKKLIPKNKGRVYFEFVNNYHGLTISERKLKSDTSNKNTKLIEWFLKEAKLI